MRRKERNRCDEGKGWRWCCCEGDDSHGGEGSDGDGGGDELERDQKSVREERR